jgi:hypothetical protein
MHRIAKEWNKVLVRNGVKVPFHAIEFYAPPEKIKLSLSNPYRGWSKTKRKKYINDLIGVLRKYSAHLIADVVDAVSFRSRSEDERKWMTGGVPNVMNLQKWRLGKPNSPYHFALRIVVECCAVRIPDGDKVHIFMSEQNQFEGYALQLYRAILDTNPPIEARERLDDSMTFGSHKKYPVLQAADLVCYHFYQFGLERRLNPQAIGSKTFRQLLGLVENSDDLKFGDAESIERIVLVLRQNERRRQQWEIFAALACVSRLAMIQVIVGFSEQLMRLELFIQLWSEIFHKIAQYKTNILKTRRAQDDILWNLRHWFQWIS